METRVFLVSVNAEILDTISHEALTDKGFMELSRREGLIYKLNDFQKALNSQEINMENYWVRIIEVNKPTSVWDFVQKTLSHNCYCDVLSESDDYQKIVDGEINGYAETIYNEWLEEGLNEDEIKTRAKNELNKVNAYLFEESIKNFLKID